MLERDYDMKTDGKRVARLRREISQDAIRCKPRTSIPDDGHRKHLCLLPHLAIDRPDRVWCTDITHAPWRPVRVDELKEGGRSCGRITARKRRELGSMGFECSGGKALAVHQVRLGDL